MLFFCMVQKFYLFFLKRISIKSTNIANILFVKIYKKNKNFSTK